MKTEYLYNGNKLFGSRNVFVVTAGYDGEEKRPVAIVQTQSEAERLVAHYNALVDYTENEDGDEVEVHMSAKWYPMVEEYDELTVADKICAYAAETKNAFARFAERFSKVCAAARK